MSTRPVRIANAAGFYGDRLDAMREMVEGGPIDVLTGDYLAELTMLILWKARQKDPSVGYATTFLDQLGEILGTVLDRGIRVVTNAGGLNPAGLAVAIRGLGAELGLHPTVHHIEGDDILPRIPDLQAAGESLTNLDTGVDLSETAADPVTANAYLGGWGIAHALADGADIVVCPRVTDASLVVGPAAWWHGWKRNDFDALAGAVAAGHVIECGPQACGGNYSWLDEVVDRSYPGFPIAEVANDGSSVITKHEHTGGLVSPGTVTAQLMYEIAEPAYANPDVVAHFDTLELTQQGPDRVLISGTRGSPPPDRLKVALNYVGGFRNSMTLVVTGLDIEEKVAWATDELFEALGGQDQFDSVDIRLTRFDQPDAPSEELAAAHLTITVKDRDRSKVGRRFSNATTGLFLGGYAGFHTTTPPSRENEFGVYWPTTVSSKFVEQRVVGSDGGAAVAHTPGQPERAAIEPRKMELPRYSATQTVRAPLGRVIAARSGDKGGNANIGVWTRDAAAYAWLKQALDVDAFREVLPESANLEVRRYEFDNLWALNFVVVGLLGEGVASSTRPDPQGKALGEYVRSRYFDIPLSIIDPATSRRSEPHGLQ